MIYSFMFFPRLLRPHCLKWKQRPAVGSGPPSLQNEFENMQTMERSAETDTLKQINQATSPQNDTSPVHSQPSQPTTAGRSTTKNEKRSANTLYQELSFQDNEESEENEVTGALIQFNISHHFIILKMLALHRFHPPN